jgi:DNA/RNA endonuclease G (NUC1)
MFVNVTCNGAWELSLKGQGAAIDWAELSPTSGTGNKTNVVLSYDDNTSDQTRFLEIVITSGTQWSTCQVTQSASDEPEDDSQEDDQPALEDMDLTKAAWMELPALDDRSLSYYSHSFKFPDDGKTYRNYSFGWSQDDLVAVWVAYPLCKFYTNKTVGRTDAWAYDPLLGSAYSSAPFGGYGGSYARGHQLPSADRLCCKDANVQTFYGTNLTPQLNGHNEGIWQALEDRVRTIANNSDTTYVVTGCMVRNPIGTTTDSDGKKMSVPSHYFKALLRYSKASTLGQWSAAGFYLEHRNYSKGSSGYDFKAVSMSIDELEEKTGLDFFVNLPAKIGEDAAARLEAQDPVSSSVWW